MNAPLPEEPSRLLLLGEDETRYGAFRLEVLPSSSVACALSVGADPASPALVNKGRRDVPNEDALLVLEQGDRVLLAVADAHYGSFASHALLRQLDAVLRAVPGNPAALMRALQRVGVAAPDEDTGSETSLVVAVLRRELGAGFGFSYGDSTCTAVGGAQRGRAFNRKNALYVTPSERASLGSARASFFDFDVAPGGLLLAFTDGVDECHYRSARTSLGPATFVSLFEEVGPDAAAYAGALAAAALAGLPGHPGGQDNIALAVVATGCNPD